MSFNLFKLPIKVSFNNVGIVYNPKVVDAIDYAVKIQEIFKGKNINSTILTTNELLNKFSLVIVVGGDGSILKTARFCAQYAIPLLGFNIGRLGFLTQAGVKDIEETLEKLFAHQYTIEKRMLLFTKGMTALNEMVIKGSNLARTNDILVEVDGKKVGQYRADGLIVSTPTGSTAYNLSAGGPILYPALDTIVITPICPHTLNIRPIVVPAGQKIMISSLEEKNILSVSADGQETLPFEDDEKIVIEKYNKYARLIFINRENDGFYSVLREKLNWGVVPNS